MKKTKYGFIILIIFIFEIIYINTNIFAVIDSPIQDYGTFEVTVLDMYSIPANMSRTEGNPNENSFHENYIKVKLNKIINYFHDQRANYKSLSTGDELEVMFHSGMKDWLTLEGKPVVPGDILTVEMNNTYRDEIDTIESNKISRGWRIFKYDIIKESKNRICIITNKKTYGKGEKIMITVKNNFDKSIWYWAENKSQTQSDTVKQTFEGCKNEISLLYFPPCNSEEQLIPVYKEIKPSESVELELKLKYIDADFLKSINLYKCKIVIWFFYNEPGEEAKYADLEWYSNKFILKGKKNIKKIKYKKSKNKFKK